MKNRIKAVIRWAIFFLSVVAGILLLFPVPRYWLVGHICGEQYYLGMPLSYWRHRIRQYLDKWESESDPAKTRSSLWEKLGIFVSKQPFTGIFASQENFPPLIVRDSQCEEFFVLLALFEDPDPRVRMWAVDKVYFLGWKAKPAAAALVKVLDNPGRYPRLNNLTVGQLAGMALLQADPAMAAENAIQVDPAQVPEFGRMLTSPVPYARLHAARQLYHLSYVLSLNDMRCAIPELQAALRDNTFCSEWDDSTVSNLAELTLHRLRKSPEHHKVETGPGKEQ